LSTRRPHLPGRKPAGRLNAFLASSSGVGAVEFALVAPVLLLLYLGGCEISIAMSVHRKVTHAATTVADLVTQKQTLEAEELTGIMRASATIIAPYSSKSLKLRVTAVKIDAAGKATVQWSCPSTGMTKLAAGTAYALPASFAGARNRSVIVSETVFAYTPLSAAAFTGPIEMGSVQLSDPRIGTVVNSAGCETVAL
jgi:Flp pilus assembly protein TadG